jgi:hypothetical protein
MNFNLENEKHIKEDPKQTKQDDMFRDLISYGGNKNSSSSTQVKGEPFNPFG